MTDQTTQEPTMEEILASIRRIISEDDAPAEAAQETVVEAAADPEPEISYEADEEEAVEDEVLELTEPYAPEAEVIGDLDITPVVEPEPEVFAEAPVVEDFPASNSGLVSQTTEANAANAFAGLAASISRPASEVADMPFDSGNTVEGMVRDMLRPMLKSWLDANLPSIVEREVRKEVERIARSAN